MELTLTRLAGTQVAVACNQQFSHTLDLSRLIFNRRDVLLQPPDKPEDYGKAIYDVLFSAKTSARQALDANPSRILLVTTDNDLDAIPWEYTCGPAGFLILDYPFVRSIPTQRLSTSPTRPYKYRFFGKKG